MTCPALPRRTAVLAAAGALAVLATGCGGSGGSGGSATSSGGGSTSSASPGSVARTITIAIGGPLSGPEKPTGDQLKAGAQLAVKEINDAGGISGGPRKGATLVLRYYDDADDPAKAASTARDAVSDPSVAAFVGSALSDGAVAAAPIASRAGFSYLAAYASSPKILEAATGQKSVFVVAPTFPAYSQSVTDVLIGDGHKRPAVINLTGTYGDGVAMYAVQRLAQVGIKPVSQTSFAFGDTDFRTQLAKAKAANPDSLIMVGLADSDAAILEQAAQLGLKVPAYDPGGITNSDTFLEDAGSLANGVVGNSPTDAQRNTPAAQKLRSGYQQLTGESVVPDPAAFAYEGVEAVAAAFADGASGRSDLAQHLHRIKIADTGVGPLSFSADGSRVGGILYVFRISSGKPVFFTGYQQTGPQTVQKVGLQH